MLIMCSMDAAQNCKDLKINSDLRHQQIAEWLRTPVSITGEKKQSLLQHLKQTQEGYKSKNRLESYFQLIKAQREVQDLGKLFGQGLLSLQVLSGVVESLAGQSYEKAAQRRFCEENNNSCVRHNKNADAIAARLASMAEES